MTYDELERYLAAEIVHLQKLKPNFLITFNFNCEISAERARAKMTHFIHGLQRRRFGRDWCKQYEREWPVAKGYLEHPESNLHYHVLARFDEPLSLSLLQDGTRMWKDICPPGELHVCDPLPEGALGPLIYCTKKLRRTDLIEEIYVYCDTRHH